MSEQKEPARIYPLLGDDGNGTRLYIVDYRDGRPMYLSTPLGSIPLTSEQLTAFSAKLAGTVLALAFQRGFEQFGKPGPGVGPGKAN